ncbi:DNA mismatch repair protein Mlh1 [Anabrus simplex]|uniref:DNA mismatch repair protein Mlh1 n=1 Tax=Anabrus simplex TaxID=316456 RepID=UPI0034DD2950
MIVRSNEVNVLEKTTRYGQAMERPRDIVKLDETVVNRIAAGEVVQRPASALKELLENSLDAKATSIHVTVKEGGLKLLQIQDNGTGIQKKDLEILCERFTTSKLHAFEDLRSLTTYGFRGEALASISHVAHLTVITKTASDKCAYKVSYEDGKWTGPPVPCGGKQGTQIIVENLFHNVATRQKMVKNASEEFQKIGDVVSRYAIHNSNVGFALKKYGDDEVNLKTLPNSTTVDNIRTVYGTNVAKELIPVETEDETLQFKFHGHITNLNYHSPKLVFLLFINNRLVDSDGLKKELDQLYSMYLPTGSHPFLYLSLELNPQNIDVNVHPTKHNVYFLHEDAIIKKIKMAVQRKILGGEPSRTYQLQSLLPSPKSVPSPSTSQQEKDKNKVYAYQKVHTSSSEQKLDKFFSSPQPTKSTFSEFSDVRPNGDQANPIPVSVQDNTAEGVKDTTSKRREFRLTSLLELRREVTQCTHHDLQLILSGHTFVGCVDISHALIQHSTDLYLCDTRSLSEELFYQLLLADFGNFGVIKFTNPMPLAELLKMAQEDSTKQIDVTAICKLLVSRSPMLEDYFSMEIDNSGNLCSLPLLLKQYFPDMAGLPEFVVRLGTLVNWQQEKECFATLSREIARFYCHPADNTSSEDKGSHGWKWTTEHIIYPALKKNYAPPKSFLDRKAILHIARLQDLYSVFERC